MKTIEKPAPFIGSTDCAVAGVKKILMEQGYFSSFPEDQHDKITNDFMFLGGFTLKFPPENECNRLVPALKETLFIAYFTILSVSKYRINVEHYLDAFMDNFNTLIRGEGMDSVMLNSALSLGVLGNSIVDLVMERNALEFIESYTKEQWPDIMADIEHMTSEEIENKRNEITNNNQTPDENNQL